MIKSIVIFVVIQLLTVITSTVKSIATVKSSPTVAGIINAVAYTFNAVVVKLITSQGIYVVLLVTFLSNLIGVPLGKVIMNKLEKERLWVYNATIKNISKNDINRLKLVLKERYNTNSIYQEIIPDELYEMKIYACNCVSPYSVNFSLNSLTCSIVKNVCFTTGCPCFGLSKNSVGDSLINFFFRKNL